MTRYDQKPRPILALAIDGKPEMNAGLEPNGCAESSSQHEIVGDETMFAGRAKKRVADECVNDTFSLRPAALIAPASSLRRASSTSTESSESSSPWESTDSAPSSRSAQQRDLATASFSCLAAVRGVAVPLEAPNGDALAALARLRPSAESIPRDPTRERV